MTVRFVIGRAGSGKTHHCLESVRERLREDAVDGPRLLLLVPEQAGLQTELAVLGSADIAGAHRLDVVSFQRLAKRVLDSSGRFARQAITESARAMIIRHLAGQHAKELRYYRRVERHVGFAGKIGRTFTELIQEAITPDDLAPAMSDNSVATTAARAKIHDIRLLYAAYLDYLGDDRIDPSQYLQEARARLPDIHWLDGAELWVDGFASLSEQEVLTFIELAKRCRLVEFTMMLDPALGGFGAGGSERESNAELFRRPLRTWQDLSRRLTDAGLMVADPLVLNRRPMPRFVDSPSLERLERTLFAAPLADKVERSASSNGVAIAQLGSRRLEVDYAVARVCEWVQRDQEPYRYRDVALIVRNLDLYHDLLCDALDARGVPYFIDRRRPVSHHPLVQLLCAVVGLITKGSSLESIRAVLKTGLLPIVDDELDEFENYLIAYGIQGPALWQQDDWTAAGRLPYRSRDDAKTPRRAAEALSRINGVRRRLYELFGAWLAFASDKPVRDGRAWVEAVRGWFEKLGAASTIERWARAAMGEGETGEAAEHEQVWRDVQAFLDDFATAFVERNVSAEELSACLEQGLHELSLGLAPPMIDQLLVGEVERSRHPTIKAAVILGCNDGVFPRTLVEDAILNDDDRRMMRDLGLGVAEPARDRIPDESTLFYIAATRASEQVVFTFAAADDAGKKLRPSPYLEAVSRACPEVEIEIIPDPKLTRELWDVQTHHDLVARLAMEFRDRPARSQDQRPVRARFNELYESTRIGMVDDDSHRFALTALAARGRASLTSASVDRLYSQPLRTSVSQLETYAACSFQHFARYALRLRERTEADLAPLDIGLVHHSILEEFVRDLSQKSQTLGELSDDEVNRSLRHCCRRVMENMPEAMQSSTARDAYVLRRSASQVARIIGAQRSAGRLGRFRPHAAELPFGFDESQGLPALELTTPAGRTVLLRGYIDRVDLAELGDELLGVVVDYKRTRDKKVDMSEVYHGLSLQLISYLLVIARHGKTLAGRTIRPGGALFVSLAARYELVAHPAESENIKEPARGVFSPRGLIAEECAPLLDSATEPGWSHAYKIHRKHDGSLGNISRSDVLEGDDFQRVMDHTQRTLGRLADDLVEGVVDVKPFRLKGNSPCTWCAMSSVCRFEMGLSDVRFLESLGRGEMLDRLRGDSQA